MGIRERTVTPEHRHVSSRKAFMATRQKQLLQHVMSRWPRRGRLLLDVGCGAGRLSEFLWQGGFDMSCLEPDPTLLEAARARLGNRAAFYIGTPDHLPFDDRSFDYVALVGPSACPSDPRPALTEALRVAARGVAIGFVNACSAVRFSRESAIFMPPPSHRPDLKALCSLIRDIWSEGSVSFGSVLLGPPGTWHEGGISAFVNSLRLPLPLGAYVAVSVTRGAGPARTPLILRIGNTGLKDAATGAACPQRTQREKA
jgi:SAM-dependent methyltransferase